MTLKTGSGRDNLQPDTLRIQNGMGNPEQPTLAGESMATNRIMQPIPKVNSRRIHRQSTRNPNKDPAAPIGKIVPPLRAKFEQPLFCSPLLSPSQISERPGRITGAHSFLKPGDTIGI
jgi:hypothetical protein